MLADRSKNDTAIVETEAAAFTRPDCELLSTWRVIVGFHIPQHTAVSNNV
jgi:hypothetical protein